SSKNWPGNKWTNYQLSIAATGRNFLITGNDATTLNLREWGDPCCLQTITPGQTYRIGFVVQGFDQGCTGQATPNLNNQANPTPPATFNQTTGECYSWNNVGEDGVHVNFRQTSPNILPGRDYFNDTQMPGYTPYVYPHPLVSGAGPSPSPSVIPT